MLVSRWTRRAARLLRGHGRTLVHPSSDLPEPAPAPSSGLGLAAPPHHCVDDAVRRAGSTGTKRTVRSLPDPPFLKETAMKALVYLGPGKKAWQDMPRPVLKDPSDAIVRILKATICGTDLHILKGDV